MRKLPLGIQTFSEIIEGNMVYVDKTDLIWQLAHDSKFNFLSRPRRFGKSLMLSTLESYFRGDKHLFAGLRLEQLQAESGEQWREYPIIKLSLSGGDGSLQGLQGRVNIQFLELDEMHGFDTSGWEIGDRFARMIMLLRRKYNSKVVILIDEYDAPLLETLGEGMQEQHQQVKAALRSLYLNLKNYEQYIHFAMLTGISQFSQLSVFSGLNALEIHTLVERYSNICGITQSELEGNFGEYIEDFAKSRGVSLQEMLDLLRKRYDGYRFTIRGEHLYNPFGLLNALKGKDLSNHWMRTGHPMILEYLAPKFHINIQVLEEGVEVFTDDLGGVVDRFGRPTPFLYQTGYVTIREAINERTLIMTLPNQEVKTALAYMLIPKVWEWREEHVFKDLLRLKALLYAGDIGGFMEQLKPLFASVFGGNEPKDSPVRESHFRNALFVVFTLLNQEVRMEVPGSKGRADVELETPSSIYIFELKLKGRGATTRDALKQIRERGYGDKFLGGEKPVLGVGAVFDSEGEVEWEAIPYAELPC